VSFKLCRRETNKNSARKMRLQRKEELALLMKEKHTLVDQATPPPSLLSAHTPTTPTLCRIEHLVYSIKGGRCVLT